MAKPLTPPTPNGPRHIHLDPKPPIIKVAKRSFCSKLSYRSKLGSVWKVVKRMNNTNTNDNIPASKKGNSFTTGTAEQANVLRMHFAKESGTGNYSESFQRHKEEFEKVIIIVLPQLQK